MSNIIDELYGNYAKVKDVKMDDCSFTKYCEGLIGCPKRWLNSVKDIELTLEDVKSWIFWARKDGKQTTFYVDKDFFMSQKDFEEDKKASAERFKKYYNNYLKLVKFAKANGVKVKTSMNKEAILYSLKEKGIQVPEDLL